MRVYLYILGAVLGVVRATQSPLNTAHCRANCIQQLATGVDCDQADCRSCWEECERPGTGCDRDGPCDAGCRLACHFHRQLVVQRPPVSVTRGRDVILVSGPSAAWPAPADTPGPHVFVLMCRLRDNTWAQVVQTLQLRWTLPDPGACLTVRVMVVGPQGLVTVYSPATSPLQDAGLILRSVGKDIFGLQQKLLKGSSKDTNQDGSWRLREVSLIHQGVLVIAEVSWVSQSAAVYLVTWELAGGGLKGHLLTDSTTVTLSLWPDTVYHIQVEEVQEGGQRVSEPLVLDTRKATPLTIPLAKGHPGLELVACGLLVFLAVLLAASYRRFTLQPPPKETATTDHFKLFPPPVRLLSAEVPDRSLPV